MRNVYLKAARAIAEREYYHSCSAVSAFAPHERPVWSYRTAFGDTAFPDGTISLRIAQFSRHENGERRAKHKARDLRVLALLFMAAACEDLP